MDYPDFVEVRARVGGLKGVMRALGDAPAHEHHWKALPSCPFCQRKGKAGVYVNQRHGGQEEFKCQHHECPGNRAVTEVGYIALKDGLSESSPVGGGPSPAYERLLKLAGLWQEPEDRSQKPEARSQMMAGAGVPSPAPEPVPQALPEPTLQIGRRLNPRPAPTTPAAPASRFNPAAFNKSLQGGAAPGPVAPEDDGLEASDGDAALIQECLELIATEGQASVSLFQRRFRIGYGRACRVMDELERRGVVGPKQGAEPRVILVQGPKPPGASAGAPVPSDNHLPPVGGLPGPVAPPSDGGAAPVPEAFAGKLNAGSGDPDGDVVPAMPGAVDAASPVHNSAGDALQSPSSPGAGAAAASGPAPVIPEGMARITIDGKVVALFPAREEVGGEENKAASGRRENGKPQRAAETAALLEPGVRALRWFYEQLTPTSVEMRPCPGGALAGGIPDPLPTAVLRQLEYVPVSLLERRGLTPETCAALGFRANPRSNEEFLYKLLELFDWDEVLASGLWLEADRKRKLDRRPNTQFCGKGQAGRKPEKEKKSPDDKWQWGWCQPVLIPYFNEQGEVVKLRPHKGGAAVGTAAGAELVYVPRAVPSETSNFNNQTSSGRPGEGKFFTVVMAEGEFKAAALWQEVGPGALLNYGDKAQASGICALPGISFARNKNYRADLEILLRAWGARRVVIAFDDEDKSHEPLRKRFDAKKYMRYLAVDLARKLHVQGRYAPLPLEWRDKKGKADWDGGLVYLINEKLQNSNINNQYESSQHQPPSSRESSSDQQPNL